MSMPAVSSTAIPESTIHPSHRAAFSKYLLSDQLHTTGTAFVRLGALDARLFSIPRISEWTSPIYDPLSSLIQPDCIIY